jgi:hypothetical protein
MEVFPVISELEYVNQGKQTYLIKLRNSCHDENYEDISVEILRNFWLVLSKF